MAQLVKNLPAMQETQETKVWSLGQEDPLEYKMATHLSILKNPMDRGVWRVTVHGVTKNRIQLNDGEGNGNPLQCSCLENPMDGGAWWAAVHGVSKSRTRLSDFTFTFHFHALKKEMATHSSVLAWRIPGKAEPGGLLSVGSHRVGHDWSDLVVVEMTEHRQTSLYHGEG